MYFPCFLCSYQYTVKNSNAPLYGGQVLRRLIGITVFLLLIVSNSLLAEQVLVLDRQYTHTADGGDDKYMGFSIFQPEEGVPENWVDPVNYAGGTAYFRLTVYSRPSEKSAYYQFCFQRDLGYGFQELCSGRKRITTTGVYEWNEPLSSWWEPEDERYHVDFTRPISRLLVVCWKMGNSGYEVLDDRWGYGDNLTEEEVALFFPMEVRFQVVLVSEGGAFEGFPGDVAVDEQKPSPFSVSPAYPNPFNGATRIRYELPSETVVELSIYDLLGRRITTIVNAAQSAGIHEVVWNGDDEQGMTVGSGVYFYRITAGEHIGHGRMLFLK